MKRVMCVYFPHWPLQRLWLLRPGLKNKPVALIEPQTAGGSRVLCCCARARRAGIRAGMPVAEARAIKRQLVLHEADPAADLRALQRLAVWAERYSPIVGLEEDPAPQSLLVDVTGCAGYFHGEDRLAERVVRELQEKGLEACVVIANTIGAAWALAHHAGSFLVAGEDEPALRQLPPAALRLPEDALRTLAKLGIHRIEQLAALPRPNLHSGFGPIVLQRLDQALGRLPELIVPYRVLPEVQARWSFESPVERREFLNYALDQLIQRIADSLRQRNRGARQLLCCFYQEGSEPLRIDVGLYRPSRSAEHLGKLLHTRLEEVRFDRPVSGICVRVPSLEIIAETQCRLFDVDETSMDELSRLIDRLVSRLGRQAVSFATLIPDPQPEFACRFQPAIPKRGARGTRDARQETGDKRQETGDKRQETGDKRQRGSRVSRFVSPVSPHPSRPVQIWRSPVLIEVVGEDRPRTIRRAGEEQAVIRAWGPERIETGWWRGHDIHRDYYVVETERGSRWWIFRRHEDGHWFLHGSFD